MKKTKEHKHALHITYKSNIYTLSNTHFQIVYARLLLLYNEAVVRDWKITKYNMKYPETPVCCRLLKRNTTYTTACLSTQTLSNGVPWPFGGKGRVIEGFKNAGLII